MKYGWSQISSSICPCSSDCNSKELLKLTPSLPFPARLASRSWRKPTRSCRKRTQSYNLGKLIDWTPPIFIWFCLFVLFFYYTCGAPLPPPPPPHPNPHYPYPALPFPQGCGGLRGRLISRSGLPPLVLNFPNTHQIFTPRIARHIYTKVSNIYLSMSLT
jgi:hypothetical protein